MNKVEKVKHEIDEIKYILTDEGVDFYILDDDQGVKFRFDHIVFKVIANSKFSLTGEDFFNEWHDRFSEIINNNGFQLLEYKDDRWYNCFVISTNMLANDNILVSSRTKKLKKFIDFFNI